MNCRYVCCAGYMPCSGSCGERDCPEVCLCTEVLLMLGLETYFEHYEGIQGELAMNQILEMNQIEPLGEYYQCLNMTYFEFRMDNVVHYR